jgi:hypothetical protein
MHTLETAKRFLVLQNVGQNNVELWSLESGGGWIHPVSPFSDNLT